jgi:hypothetical protein
LLHTVDQEIEFFEDDRAQKRRLPFGLDDGPERPMMAQKLKSA